jgi:hypothetical protein
MAKLDILEAALTEAQEASRVFAQAQARLTVVGRLTERSFNGLTLSTGPVWYAAVVDLADAGRAEGEAWTRLGVLNRLYA